MEVKFRLVVSLILLSLFSCEYGHFQHLSGEPTMNCDTMNVAYSKSVQPILKASCYGCHSTAVVMGGGGLDLENFASLKDYLNFQYQNDGMYGSKFSHTIEQQGSLLYMPPTTKMNNCELAVISKWIREGAPQN